MSIEVGEENEVFYRGLRMNVYPPMIFYHCLAQFQAFQRLHLPLETMLDIGAHHGSMSCLAAHAGAKNVVAVEPVHTEQIKLNMERNDFSSVIELVEGAVGASGRLSMLSFDHGGMQSVLYKLQEKTEVLPRFEVDGVSFLDLCGRFERIDFLKIDVEGSEFVFLTPTDDVREALSKVGYIDLEIHPLGEEFYEPDDERIASEYRVEPFAAAQRMVDFVKSCGFSLEDEREEDGYRIWHIHGERDNGE